MGWVSISVFFWSTSTMKANSRNDINNGFCWVGWFWKWGIFCFEVKPYFWVCAPPILQGGHFHGTVSHRDRQPWCHSSGQISMKPCLGWCIGLVWVRVIVWLQAYELINCIYVTDTKNHQTDSPECNLMVYGWRKVPLVDWTLKAEIHCKQFTLGRALLYLFEPKDLEIIQL